MYREMKIETTPLALFEVSFRLVLQPEFFPQRIRFSREVPVHGRSISIERHTKRSSPRAAWKEQQNSSSGQSSLRLRLMIIARPKRPGGPSRTPVPFISVKYKNTRASLQNWSLLGAVTGSRSRFSARRRVRRGGGRRGASRRARSTRARLAIHGRAAVTVAAARAGLHLARWQHNGNNNN